MKKLIYCRCTSNLDSKNFVNAVDQNTAGFMYLREKFPRISYIKIKEGEVVGPQILESIQNVKFEEQLSEVEKAAWKSLKIGKS